MPRGNNNNKKKGAAKDPPGKAKANKQPRIEPQETRVSKRNKERKAQPEQQPQQQAAAASRRPRVSVGSAQSASSSSDSESISNFMSNRNKKRAAKIIKETNDGSGLDDDDDDDGSQEMPVEKKHLVGVGVHLTLGIFTPSQSTSFKHITLINGAKQNATALTIDSKFEEVKAVVGVLLSKASPPYEFAPHNQTGANLFVRQQKQEQKETAVPASNKVKQTQSISNDDEWASALLTIAHHESKEPPGSDKSSSSLEEDEKVAGIYLDLLCCAKQQPKKKTTHQEANPPTATKTIIHVTLYLHSPVVSKFNSEGEHEGYRSQNMTKVKAGEMTIDLDAPPPKLSAFYTPLYTKAQGHTLYASLAVQPSLWLQEKKNTTHFSEVKSGSEIMQFIRRKMRKDGSTADHPPNESHFSCFVGFGFAQKKEDADAVASDDEPPQVFSQDAEIGLFSSPAKSKAKRSGRQARQRQTWTHVDIQKFILRLYKDDCQWNCFFHGLTWAHTLYLQKRLAIWRKTATDLLAHEVFQLKQDQEDTWPTFKDFFDYAGDEVVDLGNEFSGHQPKRGAYPPDPTSTNGNPPRRGDSNNNSSSHSGRKEGRGNMTLAQSQNNIAHAQAGNLLPKTASVQVTNPMTRRSTSKFVVYLNIDDTIFNAIYQHIELRRGGRGKSVRSFPNDVVKAVTGDENTLPSKKVCLQLVSKANISDPDVTWDTDQMKSFTVDELYKDSKKNTTIKMNLIVVDIDSDGSSDGGGMNEI